VAAEATSIKQRAAPETGVGREARGRLLLPLRQSQLNGWLVVHLTSEFHLLTDWLSVRQAVPTPASEQEQGMTGIWEEVQQQWRAVCLSPGCTGR
jgi:hypothetical protein